MTTSRLVAACDPTQWVQSLITIHRQINQETQRDIITKKIFQWGLSAVTAVTCIPACGTEVIKLVGDISCNATGGVIRGVQYITSPAWLESFYQAISGRPSLSYRLERIVGQAFGPFISVCGIFLRADWAIQQHQSLGNYIPSQTSEVPPPKSPPTAPPPPSAKVNPPPLKSVPKQSPQTELLPPPDATGTSPSFVAPDELAPPSAAPASSETTPDSASAEEPKKKKKGVRINSTPIEGKPPASTPAAKPPASPLDEIKRKGQEQSLKGEETATKLQEEEKAKQGKKTLSSEGKAISGALTTQKAKVKRHQSAYFKGFDPTLGNLVDGKIILRDLAKDLSNIPFSTDEQILAGTFGEYVLLKFEEENTPIKVHQVCVITDEDWNQTFSITIVKTEKDPTTGKDIILEAAISW